jgi:hypothetical protein
LFGVLEACEWIGKRWRDKLKKWTRQQGTSYENGPKSGKASFWDGPESWERSFQNWQTVKAYPYASWLTKRFFVHATTFPNGLKKKGKGASSPGPDSYAPGVSNMVYISNQHSRHDITEILLKVALNTMTLTPPINNITQFIYYSTIFRRQGFCDQVCYIPSSWDKDSVTKSVQESHRHTDHTNIYLSNMLSYQLVNIYLQISKLTKVITVDLSIHMIEMCFLYKAMSTFIR